METLTIKDKKQEQFENFIKELNPNFAFYVNAIGCPIIEADELKNAKGFCIICENPKSYDSVGCVNDTRKMTEANFSYIAAGIRKSVTGENDLCSGQLNKSFFSNIEENADVVLVLYNIHGNGVGKTYRFAGFVCCNDLSIVGKHHADECDKIGGDPGGKTLYIDAICGKINELGPELDFRLEQGERPFGIGNVILKNVEDYARMRGFVQLKLSALTYIINYYRKIGYLHNKGCNDSEDEDLERLGNKVLNCIFKSENASLLTYHLEKRILMEPCNEGDNNNKKDKIAAAMLGEMGDSFYDNDVGTSEENNNIENLDAILEYLRVNTIYNNEIRQRVFFPITSENIGEICKHNDTNNDGPIGLYQLITKLGSSGYTVAFDGENIVSARRQSQQVNINGDEIDMSDEGYTMRKCLSPAYRCHDNHGNRIIDKVCIKNESLVQGGVKKKKKKTKKSKKKKSKKKTKTKKTSKY